MWLYIYRPLKKQNMLLQKIFGWKICGTVKKYLILIKYAISALVPVGACDDGAHSQNKKSMSTTTLKA